MAVIEKDGRTFDIADDEVAAAQARGYRVLDAAGVAAADAATAKATRPNVAEAAGTALEAAAAGVVDAAIAIPKHLAMQAQAPGVLGRAIGEAIALPSDPREAAAVRKEMARQQDVDKNAIARRILELTGSEGLGIDIGSALTSAPSLTGGPLGAISGRQAVRDAAGILTSGGNLASADDRAREYDAAARQRALDNPGSALAGSVAGNVAGALLTGGGVSALAGKGSTLAARLGLMAADGALGGIGAADESAWLQGRASAKAEDVIASMGLGAVFGGALGGLGEVGGSLWRRATTGLGQDVATMAGARTLGEAAEQAAQPLTEKAAKTLVAGTKAVMGLTDEQAAAYERGLTSRAFREVVSDPTGAAQKAARELAAPLETLDRQATRAIETFSGEVRPEEVKRWLAKGGGADSATQIAAARQTGLDVAERIERGIASIAGEEEMQAFAKDVPELLRTRLAAATTPAEAFEAIYKGKQELQGLVKGARIKLAGGSLKGSTRREVVDALYREGGTIDALEKELRAFTEQDEIWGAAAAATRERNEAAHIFFGLKAEAEKLYKKPTDTGVLDSLAAIRAEQAGEALTAPKQGVYFTGNKKVGLVDENTFSRNLMQSGRTDARPADEIFDGYLYAAKKLADAVEKHGGDVDAAALRKATSEIDTVRDGYLSSQRAWNALQETQEKTGGSYVQQLANSAPVLGAMLGGPAGAAVGGALAVVARGATDPTGTIRAIAQVDKLTQLVDRRLNTGVREMLTRRAPSTRAATRPRSDRSGAARGATARAAAAGLVGFLSGDQTPSQAYSERAAQIEALTDDPERMALASAESLDGFAQRFPVLGGEVALKGSAALEFLRSKQPAPSTVETVFGGRQVVVTDREAAKWGRYWTATTDPLSVLDLARDGALEREHVEALQTLYPSLHAKLSATIVEQIQAGKVPYSARVQADALLGLDGAGEPAVSPQAQLARIAAAQRMAPKPRETRTAPRLGPEQASASATIWE